MNSCNVCLLLRHYTVTLGKENPVYPTIRPRSALSPVFTFSYSGNSSESIWIAQMQFWPPQNKPQKCVNYIMIQLTSKQRKLPKTLKNLLRESHFYISPVSTGADSTCDYSTGADCTDVHGTGADSTGGLHSLVLIALVHACILQIQISTRPEKIAQIYLPDLPLFAALQCLT